MVFMKWVAALAVLLTASISHASVIWIDDANGEIGTVDVATGSVTLVGNAGVVLTDIAFDHSGNLWGVDFNNLFSINKATGAATLVGSLGSGSFNALTFGSNGTLYAATNQGGSLYTVNTGTGAATLVGAIGFSSAGDLAFHGGTLYMSTTTGHLISVDTSTGSGTDVGDIGYGAGVFGLANNTDNNVLYGVAGTNLFAINPVTGVGGAAVDFSGQGLVGANGSAFFNEAVPVPSNLVMLTTIVGMGGIVIAIRRTRQIA